MNLVALALGLLPVTATVYTARNVGGDAWKVYAASIGVGMLVAFGVAALHASVAGAGRPPAAGGAGNLPATDRREP